MRTLGRVFARVRRLICTLRLVHLRCGCVAAVFLPQRRPMALWTLHEAQVSPQVQSQLQAGEDLAQCLQVSCLGLLVLHSVTLAASEAVLQSGLGHVSSMLRGCP